MAGYTALPTKNPGDLLTSALWNTYLQGNLDSGVMRMIGDQTLAIATASVTFASIPQTFAHLRLVCYARTTSGNQNDILVAQFNGDTAGNYDYQYLSGAAAVPSAAEAFGGTAAGVGHCVGGSAGANLFGGSIIDIPSYTDASRNKACAGQSAVKVGTSTGNMVARIFSGFWRSNAAITQIVLLPNAGSFDIGSRFTLYGIPH